MEKVIQVTKKALKEINRYLTIEPETEEMCLSEDETITYTADFGGGYEMDIKCCGVQFREGESNLAWSEAILFHNGAEVCCSEPSDAFEGSWTLSHGEMDFTAIVKGEEA